MGDPKKSKKRYFTPAHPWNKTAIEEEGKLKKEYGLKNKKEIYIASSFLKKYKDIAKRLIADKTAQGEKEKLQMLEKLQKIGLLPTGAKLDHVLSLQLKDILERRLQSIVCKKGYAKTMNQARQFIVHRHIAVGDKEITSPAYILPVVEEGKMTFRNTSTLSAEDHPERMTPAAQPKADKKAAVQGATKEEAKISA